MYVKSAVHELFSFGSSVKFSVVFAASFSTTQSPVAQSVMQKVKSSIGANTKGTKNKQDDFQRFRSVAKRLFLPSGPSLEIQAKKEQKWNKNCCRIKPHAVTTHGGIIRHVITASCLEELSHRATVLGDFHGFNLTLLAIFLSHI